MARRTKRSLHPYQNVPARRGVAAYVGATADAADDPAIVWPDRPVKLPPAALTPIYAGPDDVTNAFSVGDPSVPDPTTGDDDDVVKVQSGEYVLGPPSGTVLIRLVEVVVAFDDDLEAGVELVDLAAGEELLSVSWFVESAITATVDDFAVAAFGGAEPLPACLAISPNPSYQTFSATIGQRPVMQLAVRAETVSIKETAASTGTWTAGSLRVSALVGSLA